MYSVISRNEKIVKGIRKGYDTLLKKNTKKTSDFWLFKKKIFVIQQKVAEIS